MGENAKMPKISVIIPIYNVEKYLSQCLDSVINQTFKDIEIICINDGSTDNSLQILQQYAHKDKRIKIIDQQNQGLSIARNNGISQACCEYISFIDSDDYIHPKFLETLYEAIIQNNCDIAGCNFQKIQTKETPLFITTKIKVYNSALDVLLNKKNFIHFNVWNKLYKKEVIQDIRFAENLYYEDWIFNTQVFAQSNKFAWIPSKLYGYRISNNSIMRSDFNQKKLHDYVKGIEIVAEYFQTRRPQDWKKVKRTRISRTVKMLINSTIRSKNKDLNNQTQKLLKNLYQQNLIGYAGLSLKNKFKLFKFLH